LARWASAWLEKSEQVAAARAGGDAALAGAVMAATMSTAMNTGYDRHFENTAASQADDASN